jgi:hypothetical protein
MPEAKLKAKLLPGGRRRQRPNLGKIGVPYRLLVDRH